MVLYRTEARCAHAPGLCCGPRLRKGEVFAYVGLPQNLKDLKGHEYLQRPLCGGRACMRVAGRGSRRGGVNRLPPFARSSCCPASTAAVGAGRGLSRGEEHLGGGDRTEACMVWFCVNRQAVRTCILPGGLVGLALRVHYWHGRARVQERVYLEAYSRALQGPVLST